MAADGHKKDKRIGNQFWKARSKHGRDKLFASDEALWEACQEYFQWVEDNPLEEEKLFCFQGVVTRATISKMRAMTISGLCTFLDIDETTWRAWRKQKDFSTVCTRAERIMKDQKFAGAAAELLNPSIIARDLGLADKKELTGKDGGPMETKDVSKNELARRIAHLLTQGTKKEE